MHSFLPPLFRIILCLISITSFGQLKINMSKELTNISKPLIINGSSIQAERGTRDEIIITGKNMNIKNKSGFFFNNVLIFLNGSINFEGQIKPKLIDSYILCKDAGLLNSKNIIEVKSFDAFNLGKTKYIKKLANNPQLQIYDGNGTRVYNGNKEGTKDIFLPISRYDIKVIGVTFDEKVLLY